MKEKSKGEIVIYKTKGGKTTLEVKLQKETVWLTQDQMAQLFGKAKPTHYYNLDVISVGYLCMGL